MQNLRGAEKPLLSQPALRAAQRQRGAKEVEIGASTQLCTRLLPHAASQSFVTGEREVGGSKGRDYVLLLLFITPKVTINLKQKSQGVKARRDS